VVSPKLTSKIGWKHSVWLGFLEDGPYEEKSVRISVVAL
jgi:hypothetical protein